MGQGDLGKGEFLQHIEKYILGSSVPILFGKLEFSDDFFNLGAEAVELFLGTIAEDLLVVRAGMEDPCRI